MENTTNQKQVQLKDPEYYEKIKEIASIYYNENPDRLKPVELLKFNLSRNIGKTLRYLIDKELKAIRKPVENLK